MDVDNSLLYFTKTHLLERAKPVGFLVLILSLWLIKNQQDNQPYISYFTS